ncbi:MAG: hypothetical protein ABI127_10430 [Dokdonella sp.]
MPILFRVLAFCVPCVVLCSQPALAGDVDWRVALSGSTASISQPPLPAAHTFRGAGLADAGAGLLGFQWSANTNLLNPDGNWFESGSTFTQYAGVGVIGAQGPGRSGAESTHVFRRLYYGDAFNAAARAFGATANDPADPAGNASTGAWLWDGTKNVEIARVGASGALGPGLDGGRIYKTLHHIDDVNHDVNVWMLPNQRVLLEGRIGTASTLGSDGLSVYTPGAGNHACMLSGTTDPEYGPGIANGVFNVNTGISVRKSISTRGEVYARGLVTPTSGGPPGWFGSAGIWRFCEGAPHLAVVGEFTGQYGPDLPGNAAVFTNGSLSAFIAPSLPGSFFFTSGGKMSSATGAPSFFGLFHHDQAQQRNIPMLLENSEGALGPQIPGYVFRTNITPYNVRAAGKYAALLTTIGPAGTSSTSNNGLWRITADGAIEPVAISGNTDVYAPATGRIWTADFYKFTVFDNGDIVVLAETKNVANSSTAVSWWRLSRGAVPREILKVGDLVTVSTPGGPITAPVTAIDAQVVLGMPPSVGHASWYTANGNMLAQVTIQGYSSTTTLVRGRAARRDIIFADGFD